MLPALVIYGDCEKFDALPAAGGVLDQEYELMQDLRLITRLVGEESAARAARQRWMERR